MTGRRLVPMAYLATGVVTVAGILLGWWNGWALTVLASIFFLNFVLAGNSARPLFGPKAETNQSSPTAKNAPNKRSE